MSPAATSIILLNSPQLSDFADGKVTCFGQVIGVIVAESQPLAQRAAKAVRVTYKDLPSIITREVLHDILVPMLDSVPLRASP